MSDDDRMDAVLRQMAAEEYNRPPHIVPREQMWDAVRQGLDAGTAGGGKREEESEHRDAGVLPLVRRVPRWVYLAVAAVALLAVGIQVGRFLGPARAPLAVIPTPPPNRDSLGRDSVGQSPENVAVAPPTDEDKTKPRPRPEPERQLGPNAADQVATSAYTVAASQHLTEAEAMLTLVKGDIARGRMDAQVASWGKDLLSNTRLLLDSPAARDPVRRKLLQDLELVLVQIVQLSPNASARDRDLINGALSDDQVLTRLRTAIPLKGT